MPPEHVPQDEDDLDEPALSLFPADEMAQPVISFSTRALPHFSHFTVEADDKELRNFSNSAPHFRHL